MLAVLPQVKTGFCADPAASLVSVLPVRSSKAGPTLLAKTISAEQCKTEPEWVVAGKPPQALEQPTMCSCPPSQGGSREKSSSFSLLPHPCGSCHPFSREAGGWAACFLGSGETNRSTMETPRVCATLQQEQNSFKSRNKIRTLL